MQFEYEVHRVQLVIWFFVLAACFPLSQPDSPRFLSLLPFLQHILNGFVKGFTDGTVRSKVVADPLWLIVWGRPCNTRFRELSSPRPSRFPPDRRSCC